MNGQAFKKGPRKLKCLITQNQLVFAPGGGGGGEGEPMNAKCVAVFDNLTKKIIIRKNVA